MPDAQQSKAEVDAMLSLTRALEICLREFFGDKHYVLSQVLPLIADQKQEVLRAARTFPVALVTVYVARGSYKLNPEELKGFPDKVDEECWKKINTNQVDRVCDEHFYKLVQVNTSYFSCKNGNNIELFFGYARFNEHFRTQRFHCNFTANYRKNC